MASDDALTYTIQKRVKVKTFHTESELSEFLEEHSTFEIINIFSHNEIIILVYLFYE